MSCKYIKKSNLGEDYIKCRRDNSVRKRGCPCSKYEPTFWEYISEYFKRGK